MLQKQIVIVTPWFDGFVGGAGTLAKGLAYGLNRRGVYVIDPRERRVIDLID